MIDSNNPRDLYRFEVTAQALPGPDAVDAAQVAAYHRDGFLAVENVLSAHEVESGIAALSDLIYGRVPGYSDLQPEPEVKDRWPEMTAEERALSLRKVWRFAGHEPRLMALTQHQTIHAILEKLTGEPCRLIQDMALLKPPFIGTEKPWHQDMAYFEWSPPEKVLGAWIALDPATAENGCMHLLPGTHNEGPVPHIHRRDCQIPDERVQVERDVIVPLKPGGALFFSSLVHHGTPPNEGPSRRWAIQYHYAGVSCRSMNKAEHAGLYHENEMYAGCRGGAGKPLAEVAG